ncbi:hypothetical protein FQA39_LY09290 [Lamprigera yunnana]|nr:hypothetical protein FQA39_LY09290 [Lamprigera yunnana]
MEESPSGLASLLERTNEFMYEQTSIVIVKDEGRTERKSAVVAGATARAAITRGDEFNRNRMLLQPHPIKTGMFDGSTQTEWQDFRFELPGNEEKRLLLQSFIETGRKYRRGFVAGEMLNRENFDESCEISDVEDELNFALHGDDVSEILLFDDFGTGSDDSEVIIVRKKSDSEDEDTPPVDSNVWNDITSPRVFQKEVIIASTNEKDEEEEEEKEEEEKEEEQE